MTPELTEAEALVMAAECPLIRAAYALGDTEVIRRIERDHPPKRCEYVKQASESEKEKAK